MYKKKGLEPLIATILLIVVAVILVTIVLAWGKNFSTEGLNKTSTLLEENCQGAQLSISNCQITSDGNIVFQLKNISPNYNFDASDEFKIMVSSNNGVEAEKDLTFASEWAGLNAGDTVIARYGPNLADVNTLVTSTIVNVNVRSSICSQTSTSISNCHR